MALFNVDCFSEVLGMSVSMTVILPQHMDRPNPVNGGHYQKPFPVLYLLHGYNGDHTVWERRTSVERYVSDKGIAVVMPAVHLSFYTDMKMGFKYWTYLSEEVSKIVHDFFPQISEDPQKTFAAGLSMGGYGAFKLGLAYPERFRAVASLSGAVDVAALADRMAKNNPDFGKSSFHSIYGDGEIRGSDNDLFELANRAKGKIPQMFQWCGKQDFLYEDNVRLRDHLISLGAPLLYRESDGDHNWQYWDREIENVVNWICELLKE